ncbi:MAG: helix-turn-helix transcriptional regulator [Verrucomicrobiota bacterium]
MREIDRLYLRLKFIREAQGWTQEKFAEHANISYKYYQAIETGRKRDLRLTTLKKLSKAFGMPLSDLLDFGRSDRRVAETTRRYVTAKKKAASKK